MESQIMMIGAAIFVGSAVLIYLISVFGIREKTYDEVIEEQRRERLESMKHKSRSEKRDKYKRKYKRAKEKDEREDSVEKREETPVRDEVPNKMVELEIEPEIIEPAGTPKLKAKKAKKQKPILINKEEKSYTKPEQHVPETFHPKQLPKDEVELKHAHEEVKKEVAPKVNKVKKPEQVKKQEPVKKPEVQKIDPVVERIERLRQMEMEEEITISQVAQQMAAPPMPGPERVSQPKKTKKRHEVHEASPPIQNGVRDDAGDYGINRTRDLPSVVRNANLTDGEIQTLIDILLNKQTGKVEWNKKANKADPISMLKKQLEDKEKSLQEEQQLAMSHQSRIKELQKELSQEKGRYLVLNKTSQEKVEAKQEECLALQRRMQQAHEQHMMDMSKVKMQHMDTGMAEGQAAIIQRLQEENKQLKDAAGKAQMNEMASGDITGLQQQLKIIQGELSNNVMKLTTLDNAKRALEQKVGRYEEQIRKLEGSKKDTEGVFTRKLQEVNEELRKSQGRHSTAEKDVVRSKHAKDQADTECSNLKNRLQQLEADHSSHKAVVGDIEHKLKDAQSSKGDLEKRVRHLESQLADKEKMIKSKESEMKEVLEANTELRSCRQRQSGEGQESPEQPAGAPNGDLNTEEKIPSKISLSEHEKILNQKAEEVSCLQSEIQTKDSTISSLQGDLENQKKKNNALRERNWKAMDALSQAEKLAAGTPQIRKELNEKDTQINQLREELETQRANCREISDQLTQITSKHGELEKDQECMTRLQEELNMTKTSLDSLQRESTEKSKQYDELSEQCHELAAKLCTAESSELRLSEIQQELSETKTQMEGIRGEVEEKSDENKSLTEQIQELTTRLTEAQSSASSYSELQQELENSKKQLEQLQLDVEAKNKEHDDLSTKYQTVCDEMAAGSSAAQNVSELEDQLSVMSSQLDQLRADFETKQQENIDLLERYQKISEQLCTVTSDQGASDCLQQELTTTKSELDQVREDLERVSQEKDELREKNWKAMEALNKAEQEVQHRISDVISSEKENGIDLEALEVTVGEESDMFEENSSVIVQEELTKVRTKLRKIFPAISVDMEDEESVDWWDDFEEKAKEHINTCARRQSMQVEVKLSESLETQTKLQQQVEHYKQVLGDTETMLNKLQSSVETEEKKWQEKLDMTEKELHEARNEMETLQESVTKMRGSTEMKVKIESLETQLEDVEKEKETLGTELREAEDKNKVLEDDLTSVQREKEALQSDLKESQDILSSVKSELEKLKVSLAAQEQIKKRALLQESRLLELDQMKTSLNREKASNEELAQSNTKLNSLLKIGQDALHSEQETVKQLQAQLEEAKKTSSSEDSQKELEALKTKLDEREKQLEKEITTNKSLSQKLAASQDGHDVGTSV